MKENAKLFVSALRAAVTDAAVTLPTSPDWNTILTFASSHKVTGLLYAGIRKDSSVPQGVRDIALNEYRQTVFRSIQLEECRKQIGESLQQAGVDYVLLKGSVLKDFYPIPELRTMTDIDLLVKAQDDAAIATAFSALGARLCEGDGNHFNYCFPQNIMVECHPNLVHPTAPFGTELNPGWQYCKREEDGHCKMTADGLYLHTLCHLAEHFLSGGVGVRFVLDIWLLRKAKGAELDFDFLDSELQKIQLKEFSDNIVALGDMWFGGAEPEKDLSELEDYIISSGSHGYSDRAALNAVSLSSGSRHLAVIKRAFYSREELENRYPWSRKSVLLLPAAWCVRAFCAVTKRGHLVRKWVKDTNRVSNQQIIEQREKLARFGIRPKV